MKKKQPKQVRAWAMIEGERLIWWAEHDYPAIIKDSKAARINARQFRKMYTVVPCVISYFLPKPRRKKSKK